MLLRGERDTAVEIAATAMADRMSETNRIENLDRQDDTDANVSICAALVHSAAARRSEPGSRMNLLAAIARQNARLIEIEAAIEEREGLALRAQSGSTSYCIVNRTGTDQTCKSQRKQRTEAA